MTKTLKTSIEFAQGKNNIDWIGGNFKEYFYDTTFTLPNAAPSETRPLERPMNDKAILAELKPEPVTLGDVLALLKGASHDHWYIFYVTDKEGILRAVRADWRRDGWNVGAGPVSSPSCGAPGFAWSPAVSRMLRPRPLETLKRRSIPRILCPSKRGYKH